MLKNRKNIIYVMLGVLLGLLLIPIPDDTPSFSKALYSSDGAMISAMVSDEQQWCFPIEKDIPSKLAQCIITFEDEYYPYHLGINPISIIKAAHTNYKAGKTLRGASTIPMQLMRMKNKHVNRKIFNKSWEAISAIKYSILHSKKSILKEWCEIAPFGGNTIGVKAASLLYFNREMDNLSWSEYALLAVMPNGPSSAHLGKNRALLKKKRDFLLSKLNKKGHFSEEELALYIDEDLPLKTQAPKQDAFHLLQFLNKKHPKKHLYHSTVDHTMQVKLNDLVEREAQFLQADDINNIAAVVIDVEKNELISYVGNVKSKSGAYSYVDIVQSARSYGSLLKPLLYAYALEYGYHLPHEIIADIPTHIGDFHPENFDKKFRGAVTLDEMIIQSLNVPAVRLLNQVGLEAFYKEIEKLNMAYINKGAAHYGLSLILGGAESNLWDMARLYKGLAQNISNQEACFNELKVLKYQIIEDNINLKYDAKKLEYMADAMADVNRPREEKSWSKYNQNYKVAWKTGTSYGHKDAWALGFNKKYMVGIWVGNENGEGRFNLTGVTKAAPIMFKVFNTLQDNEWFDKQTSSTKSTISICTQSGLLAGRLCKNTSKLQYNASHKLKSCNYHKEIMVNGVGELITENCKMDIVSKDTVFVLPPAMEYYYKKGNISYKGIPEIARDCNAKSHQLNIIYPENGVKIFLPKEGDNNKKELISKVYHSSENATLYWFLDEEYIATTQGKVHEKILNPPPGKHSLSIIDQSGYKESVSFELLEGK
jgi:penicillin-binding protein 1C